MAGKRTGSSSFSFPPSGVSINYDDPNLLRILQTLARTPNLKFSTPPILTRVETAAVTFYTPSLLQRYAMGQDLEYHLIPINPPKSSEPLILHLVFVRSVIAKCKRLAVLYLSYSTDAELAIPEELLSTIITKSMAISQLFTPNDAQEELFQAHLQARSVNNCDPLPDQFLTGNAPMVLIHLITLKLGQLLDRGNYWCYNLQEMVNHTISKLDSRSKRWFPIGEDPHHYELLRLSWLAGPIDRLFSSPDETTGSSGDECYDLATSEMTPLTRRVASLLEHQTWLNDECIIAFCQLLINRHVDQPTLSPAIAVIETLASSSECQKGDCKVDPKRYGDILSSDIILWAENTYSGTHWVGWAVVVSKRLVLYYDPLHDYGIDTTSSRQEFFNRILQRFKREGRQPSWIDKDSWELKIWEGPRQQNSINCGVLVCQFFESLSRSIFGPTSIVWPIKPLMAVELKAGRLYERKMTGKGLVIRDQAQLHLRDLKELAYVEWKLLKMDASYRFNGSRSPSPKLPTLMPLFVGSPPIDDDLPPSDVSARPTTSGDLLEGRDRWCKRMSKLAKNLRQCAEYCCRTLSLSPSLVLDILLPHLLGDCHPAPSLAKTAYEVVATTELAAEPQFDLIASEDIQPGTKLRGLEIIQVLVPGISHENELEMNGFSNWSVFKDDSGLSLGLGRGRLINHDCYPNLEFREATYNPWCDFDQQSTNMEIRVVETYAIKQIQKGQTLSVYYAPDYMGAGNQDCQCPTRCHPNSTLRNQVLRFHNPP